MGDGAMSSLIFMAKPPVQLELIFAAVERVKRRFVEPSTVPTAPTRRRQSAIRKDENATELQSDAQAKLRQLGMQQLADVLTVVWQPRLQSTAGRASYHLNLVEINPRLKELGGDEVLRTLWHEVAHLVAYTRNRRRRIAPHGNEWKQACADLGIPGESATHHLPLPSRKIKRQLVYACPVCKAEIHRVRKMKSTSACYPCCKAYNNGRYDNRFRLKLIRKPTPETRT